jgi:hypothetical protein
VNIANQYTSRAKQKMQDIGRTEACIFLITRTTTP